MIFKFLFIFTHYYQATSMTQTYYG